MGKPVSERQSILRVAAARDEGCGTGDTVKREIICSCQISSPSAYQQSVFTSHMPFLLPTQQCQSN